jgi:hypothetical protein
MSYGLILTLFLSLRNSFSGRFGRFKRSMGILRLLMLWRQTGSSSLKLLRHKRIENTMKYISMIHFKDDEFEVTTATNVEEAKQVLSAGFDYVAQKDGVMLFRKPKRFK